MDPSEIRELEQILKALANANRIQLLLDLQEPRRASEIDLAPTRRDAWSGDRPITRQAVHGHLQALEEIGAVSRVAEDPSSVKFIVNHSRLFEITEYLRRLATVQPVSVLDRETRHLEGQAPVEPISGPHLVIARGVREGTALPLDEPYPEGGWVVGRRRDCDVPLDYDPYVSAAHTRIVREGRGHAAFDLLTNRNGTHVNWRRIPRGGRVRLKAGDVIGVGLSLLVFRE